MRIELKTFAKDEDGAVAVIVALLLVVLIGFTALGVDTAYLYRERTQLQSVSDLTAMSAVAQPENANARADAAIMRNDKASDVLETLETGRYLRNPAIAYNDRFTLLAADDPLVNAVRVTLTDQAPLHFARIFADKSTVSLTRKATASRTGAASFALNSHLIALDGTALSEALALRFGGDASISAGDQQALADTQIDFGAMLAALDAATGGLSSNPAAILDQTVTVQSVITALQSVLPAPLAGSLDTLAAASAGLQVSVASIVGGIDTDLGLTATDFAAQINVSARDIVLALVATDPADEGITLNTSTSVANVINTHHSIRAGEPAAQSGWIALGEEGVQLHRAAVRIKTDMQITPDALGTLDAGVQVTSLDLPLYTELAGSTATLEHLSCSSASPDDVAARFRTSHTPLDPTNGTSVAALYLGTLPDTSTSPVNPAELGFADLLTVSIEIEVLGISLLPNTVSKEVVIQARSTTAVGASQSETVSFTHRNIADGETVKTFGSGDLLGSAVQSLLSPDNIEFRIKPQQDGGLLDVPQPILDSIVGLLPLRLLDALTTPVDTVLDDALKSVGLQVGQGELTLTGHHCERVRLVR